MALDVRERGKQPRSIAAGPYGHPFHPILVTVPIGAWVASLVFDVLSRFRLEAGGGAAATGSRWLIGIGILGALVAAVWGVIDLLGIPAGTKARATAVLHMLLNITVVVLYAINFVLRDSGPRAGEVAAFPIALSLLALALLGASGWLGGKLAYTYGVRVADEGTQAEGFTTTRSE